MENCNYRLRPCLYPRPIRPLPTLRTAVERKTSAKISLIGYNQTSYKPDKSERSLVYPTFLVSEH